MLRSSTCAWWMGIGTFLAGAFCDRASGGIWISPEDIRQLPMSGPAWNNVFDAAQNAIDTNLGSPASDGDTTAYAKALVYVRTGDDAYRQEVIDAVADVMGTEGGSVRYLGLGLLGYIIAADLVVLPPALDAEFKAWLAQVRFDNLGETRNLVEQHEQRPNNWGTTAGPSRLALALYIGDYADFDRGVDVFMGWLDGSWPHDYGTPCWRSDYDPPQGINPVGSVWAGVLPDDQRRGGCPPVTPCENYVRGALAGVIAQAVIIQRHTGVNPWTHEDNAILRAYEWIVSTGCGFPGDDEWQPWLVNWAYGSDLPTVSAPEHGKSMGYTDWTHGPGTAAPIAGGGLKIAFMGDQGDGADAHAVLQLMHDEGVSLVVHAGDFDYGDDPVAWRQQVETVFGPCPPYVAVGGNHDDGSSVWPQYRQIIEDWLNCNGINYTGVPGEMFSLTWEGIFLPLVGPGLFPGDHAGFLAAQLAANDAIWSVATWHLLMRDMQIGGKGDESGWAVYQAAREGGAIIATGHEHSYERTNLLSDMENQAVVGPDLVLAEGRTFAFVSGLGGSGIRDQERCLPTSFPYGCDGVWASIYAEQQGADFGALFIEFEYANDPCVARGYFKDVTGHVADEFFVTSTLGGCEPVPYCGDGNVDPGETCATCPTDVACAPGEYCSDGECVPYGTDCFASNGAGWQNFAAPHQGDAFTIEYDATPAASGIDGVTTLSRGTVSGYDDNAVLVRFNPSGFIDARDGDGYAADLSMPYTGGISYHFQVDVDVETHTYTVWVDGVRLANNFAFRTSQAAVATLDNWAVYNESGSHIVCGWTPNDASSCPWDLDGNGVVDSLDFLMLLESWGEYDIDDILGMLAAWGDC